MPPGKKTLAKRPSMPFPSQLSPTESLESSQPQELTPQNFDGLGDAASLAQSNNAGPPRSTRVRGKTVGKGVDKLIAHNGGEKLVVPVLPEWNSFCGINASKATSLLGLYLRMMCAVKNTPTWRHVDPATQSSIIQVVLKRSTAGKINRGFLDDGHRSGSRSFVAEMTIPVENGGSQDNDFPEVYEKTHTNKDNEWISPICAGKHAEMVEVRAECTQSSVQMTLEEISIHVLGKRKRYILGFGVGPKPSSSSPASNAASRACDEELANIKVGMEKLQMEREEEKRACEAEMEKIRMEREEEKRAREAEMEKIRMEREEEKRAREAEMEKMQMGREEAKREREEARREREEEKRERKVERIAQRMQGNKHTNSSSIHHGGHNSLTCGRPNR